MLEAFHVSETTCFTVRTSLLRNLAGSSNRARWRRRAGRRWDRGPVVTHSPAHRERRDAPNWQHHASSDGQHNRAADWFYSAIHSAGNESDQPERRQCATVD